MRFLVFASFLSINTLAYAVVAKDNSLASNHHLPPKNKPAPAKSPHSEEFELTLDFEKEEEEKQRNALRLRPC